MVEIEIVPVTAEHVAYVAARMRQADIDELWQINRMTPLDALQQSTTMDGERWTALINGKPAAIFGVCRASLLGGIGIAWLLGTRLLERHSRQIARHSKPLVAEMLRHYTVLTNVTSVHNTLSMRWLAWLGARFDIQGEIARFELCAHP